MIPKKILIVDHQASFVNFCQTWLLPAGFELDVVTKGAEALEMVKSQHFELVLMDMWPSDMDSLDLLRQLRESGFDLPVIIACEQADIAVQRVTTAMQLGVTTFIEKPCRSEVLLASVKQAFGQNNLGKVGSEAVAGSQAWQIDSGSLVEVGQAVQPYIEEQLAQLYRETTPQAILLVHRTGRLLHFKGHIQPERRLSLAGLLAGSFSAADGIVQKLSPETGSAQQFRQSLHEGDGLSLYSAQVGRDYILSVAFNPEKTNLGLARRLTQIVAAELSQRLVQEQAAPEQRRQAKNDLDEAFRQEGQSALGNLFQG